MVGYAKEQRHSAEVTPRFTDGLGVALQVQFLPPPTKIIQVNIQPKSKGILGCERGRKTTRHRSSADLTKRRRISMRDKD